MIGFSNMNPIRFKFADEYNFDHDLPYCYCQKWQFSDIIRVQIQATAPPTLNVRNVKTRELVHSIAAVQANAPAVLPDNYKLYEFTAQYMPIDKGFYYFELVEQDGTKYKSYSFDYRAEHEGTVLLRYYNTTNRAALVFETGIDFYFRVEGTIQNFQPMADSVTYINQNRQMQLLSATPYRVFTLFIGTTHPIPNWMLDIFNFAMACDTKYVDNLYFERNEQAEIEVQRIDRYALCAASVEIIQKDDVALLGYHGQIYALADNENNLVINENDTINHN